MIRRHAVRALLLAQEQILLIRTHIPDSGRSIWLTPGGGVEADEDPCQALYREVFEETGLRVNTCTGPVWRRRQQFTFRQLQYDQSEDFYLIRTNLFTPDHSHNPAASEKDIFRGFKWWAIDEIGDESRATASVETFVPLDIYRHLQNLQQHVPDQPIAVGE